MYLFFKMYFCCGYKIFFPVFIQDQSKPEFFTLYFYISSTIGVILYIHFISYCHVLD